MSTSDSTARPPGTPDALDWQLGVTAGLVTGPTNTISDVPGVSVGHATRIGDGWLSGTTVVLARDGARAGVDVRGGGPATRETDALNPTGLVETIHAITLTGGSAYGLDAAGGVMAGLADQGRGFPVGMRPHEVVPVVPTAALFDLARGGDFHARPDAALGREAFEAAWAAVPGEATAQGVVGAATGAVAGGLKGGIGSASVVLAGPDGRVVTVAALVALNALGSTFDPVTGVPWGAFAELRRPDGTPELDLRRPTPDEVRVARDRLAEEVASRDALRPLNTTLAVVATDADLTRAELTRLAGSAQAGLARGIRPVTTLSDGDVVFTLSPGGGGLPDAGASVRADAVNRVLTAGADVLTRAIVHATLAASSVQTPAGRLQSWRDLYDQTR